MMNIIYYKELLVADIKGTNTEELNDGRLETSYIKEGVPGSR